MWRMTKAIVFSWLVGVVASFMQSQPSTPPPFKCPRPNRYGDKRDGAQSVLRIKRVDELRRPHLATISLGFRLAGGQVPAQRGQIVNEMACAMPRCETKMHVMPLKPRVPRISLR
jgi:hypothetical protein